ncbi:hypothetical protein, partial [Roseisolibacter sp. H3M3-2]|uniref:hypothetical protein n=1 Tax=Roseisolibacter sp. H3M3-2 TaxID=3031323 RepID=UPI0023DB7B14
GRVGHSPAALDAVRAAVEDARRGGRAAVVALFDHTRRAAELPTDAPVVCGWSGDRAMQQAVARWLAARKS